MESGWDRHRGGRRGDQREPQIPLVGVIISILSGGLVLAMGRLGRACWRRPAGWAPGAHPFRCAEHVRQLEGESPLDNLMEVKS